MSKVFLRWMAIFCLLVFLAGASVFLLPRGKTAQAEGARSPTPTMGKTQAVMGGATAQAAKAVWKPEARGLRLATATAVGRCVVKTGWEGGTVFVRKGPGMGWRVVGLAREGEALALTGKRYEGWVELAPPGSGWFYALRWCR